MSTDKTKYLADEPAQAVSSGEADKNGRSGKKSLIKIGAMCVLSLAIVLFATMHMAIK